jgi:uncharacterized protein YgiM (DUF1202 family)
MTTNSYCQNDCNCEGLVDWKKNVTVILYDQPDGKVIDSLTHDFEMENLLIFKLIESEENFFKVQIGRAYDESKLGWIKKKDYLGTYARNYSDEDTLYLYEKPDKKSKITSTITQYYPELYEIINCKDNWVKVKLTVNGNKFSGWLEPLMQCPSPYTTCN